MWEALQGGFSWQTMLVGAIIGAAVVYMMRRKK